MRLSVYISGLLLLVAIVQALPNIRLPGLVSLSNITAAGNRSALE